jgi:alpha-methylacyl-CoA racemase
MLLAFGILAALIESSKSGKGQVVDAAMVDGAATLMAFFFGMRKAGFWSDQRGTNMLDTGAHFYDVYETADGKYVSIGSIEPQFYAEMVRLTGFPDDPPARMDRSRWPELKERLAKVIKTKTRDEWCAIMEGTDACFAPVLSMAEAPDHPHNRARDGFVKVAGVVQPAPSPRFSRTKPEIRQTPGRPGEDTAAVLSDWGFSEEEVAALRASQVVSPT